MKSENHEKKAARGFSTKSNKRDKKPHAAFNKNDKRNTQLLTKANKRKKKPQERQKIGTRTIVICEDREKKECKKG